ncbi:MAG: hypothetical protein BI182_14240 [Acetobacterium sp. MES1]|uniref:restriction endonuclease subunit S n=1 Tax=Acetobacterium sp. MES1 TaxID=1899015 RepID=UPI000B9CBF84|nr:restriction endonuclease subunit S [Acetobacterium sp. MES1]OXS25337.1 MAG: hypothetical protein BI182_14240 [Acetobacterium sp. MES1]
MSFRESYITFKLGDLCEKIGSGVTPRGGDSVYKESGIALIRSQNVHDYRFADQGLVYICEEQALKMKNVEVKPNDVLLNITGDSVARCCIVPEKVIPARVNQHVAIIRPDENILNAKYLLYWINNSCNKELLFSLSSTGATRKALTKGMIENLNISLPNIVEQKSIAATLSCLDDKIELNNRINKNLEEIAQAIFKSWFADFEPFQEGEFEDSELGRIPKGWRVTAISEFVEVINGYSYKGSDLKTSRDALLTIKNFDRNRGLKLDGFKELLVTERVKERHYVNEFDVLLACTDLTQNAEIIGNSIMLLTKMKYDRIIASMDLVKIKPLKKHIDSFIIDSILNDEKFKQYALGFTSGTTVLHLNKKAIVTYTIALPEEHKILIEFSKIIKPIYLEISQNLNNILALTELRNALLPKLMSGEIRVPIEEVN